MEDAESVRGSGFVERTRVAEALDTLRAVTSVSTGIEVLPLGEADGRVLAETVESPRNVPDFPRAAMDGYAVRAEDTFGAAARSPATLVIDPDEPGVQRATWVHTGSPVPDPADAVVKTENAREVGDDVEITRAAAAGQNVSDVGEDVESGQHLFDPGHRLRPSDLAMLRSVGIDSVTVREHPSVAVIPTGEELVTENPGPGEAIETNGLMISSLVERWGGWARYRDVVTDDREALADAIEADLDADVIVTTGGSSIGKRDLLPAVVEELGELLVHGVALKPGHPVALGQVEDTPILMLPGYPVACIVNAWQFLRPVINWTTDTDPDEPARLDARLDRKVRSEPGIRSCVRVTVDDSGSEPVATPVHESGASILSSVSLADGWIQVPESIEGYDVDETVTVEFWEAHP
ncbi:molybdopterin molybdotransferase MoeA [Halanaeroarchaeum sulfurireducens]|uniref:Molybdenum cofactor biosynthesis protein MoeA n=1 Tax=Halanaeroarchaeum sulfurireducens TaxID=1604004 RepID=A0A0F7P9S9_9EURY|nr:molybdopterin molybdotransferase MoeA [Halanaeroarchaeum sulfurireducens]AKH97537.1 molybdenum cofactor biosynthesis protein MoeA [Halanaeroarchaeum sulfurireducens]ALG81933.1 molybdenum cofactor biosynthesis protein MoeA [Halanaeroarchaeum sulfurireducens]